MKESAKNPKSAKSLDFLDSNELDITTLPPPPLCLILGESPGSQRSESEKIMSIG